MEQTKAVLQVIIHKIERAGNQYIGEPFGYAYAYIGNGVMQAKNVSLRFFAT